VLKFVAENMSRGEKGVAAAAFYQAIKLTLCLAGLLGLAVFLGATTLAAHLLGEASYAVLFQVLALDIVVYAGALPVLGGMMLGLQKFKEIATIGIFVSSVLRQVLIIVLIVLLSNFVGIVIAWVISDIAAASVYLACALQTLGRPRFDFRLDKLLRFSLPLTISSIADFAQSWFDRSLLVIFVPLTALGVYNTTIVAFGVLLAVSYAIGNALFPAYSAMQTPGQSQTLGNALRMASRYVSLAVVPLALGLLATARPALTLLVGEAYVEGSGPLMILSGIFAFTVFGSALGPMLLALAETRLVSAITIVAVVVSLAAAFLLLPIWGIVGASVARGFSMIIGTVLTIIVLRRKIGLRLDLEAITKSLIAGVTMASAVIVLQIPIYNKLLLPVYVFVGLVVYLVALRLLRAVRPEDIELIRGYLGNRLVLVTNLMSRILLSASAREYADRKTGAPI
jgi:O-antigen/teichoic acid export membrane protein